MRARDARAVTFFLISTLAVLAAVRLVTGGWIAAGALAAAYGAWLLTRPRMVRVLRRMRGETVDRTGYFWDG